MKNRYLFLKLKISQKKIKKMFLQLNLLLNTKSKSIFYSIKEQQQKQKPFLKFSTTSDFIFYISSLRKIIRIRSKMRSTRVCNFLKALFTKSVNLKKNAIADLQVYNGKKFIDITKKKFLILYKYKVGSYAFTRYNGYKSVSNKNNANSLKKQKK